MTKVELMQMAKLNAKFDAIQRAVVLLQEPAWGRNERQVHPVRARFGDKVLISPELDRIDEEQHEALAMSGGAIPALVPVNDDGMPALESDETALGSDRAALDEAKLGR